MRSCVFLIIVGLMGIMYGCGSIPSAIDALSNNTSDDTVRGVKLQAGVDTVSGQFVPSVSFMMGSLARKGKDDRTIIVIDNTTTDIVSESYKIDNVYKHVGTDTDHPRQLLETEKRTPMNNQLDEGIFVHQTNAFGMGITAGNLFNAGGQTIISIGKVGTNTITAVGKNK